MSIGSFGFSAYDSKRDPFWMEGGGGGPNPTSTFDPNGMQADGTYGDWKQYVTHVGVNGSVAAYDPVHDLVVVTVFRNSQDIRAFEAARPSEPTRTLKQAGTAPKLVQGHGWEWSETRQALVYWAGEHVFELKASSADWSTAPWTWNDLTSRRQQREARVRSERRVQSLSDRKVRQRGGCVHGELQYRTRVCVPRPVSQQCLRGPAPKH